MITFNSVDATAAFYRMVLEDVFNRYDIIHARSVKWQGRSFWLGGYYEGREAHVKSLTVTLWHFQNQAEVLVNLDNGERVCFHVYNAPIEIEIEGLEDEV